MNPFEALKCSQETFLKRLARDELDLNALDDDGKSLLHHLVINCDESLVYELLRHKADVNILDRQGSSALHLATLNGSYALVELLIHFKADLSIQSENGDTPLHMIALNRNHRLGLLAFFLVAAFDQNPAIIEIKNKQKKTFYQLFRNSIQVQIFRRFQSLNGMKSIRNEEKRGSDLVKIRDQHVLLALIALNDFESVKKMETFHHIEYLPLALSKPMIKLLKQSHPKIFESSKGRTSISGTIFWSTDLYKSMNRHEFFGKSPEGYFSHFNYFCSLNNSARVVEVIEFFGLSAILESRPDLFISNIDSLQRFHPQVAQSYLTYTTFTLKDVGNFEEQCSICRNINCTGDKWIRLKCTHQFHEDCLFEWLPFQSTCPMCRRTLHIPLMIKNK